MKPPTVISDQGLECLKSMPQLEQLHLNRCVHLSDKGMSILLDIQRQKGFDLKDLALAETFITDKGLAYVGQMATLQKVYVSSMTDIGDSGLLSLCGLPNLHYLSVEGDEQLARNGLSALAQAKGLTWLNISGCNFQDLTKSLVDLKLTYLEARNCHLYDEDLAQIAKIDTLKYLDIADNRLVSKNGLMELTKLKKLTKLVLPANGISSQNMVAFYSRMQGVTVTFGVDRH